MSVEVRESTCFLYSLIHKGRCDKSQTQTHFYRPSSIGLATTITSSDILNCMPVMFTQVNFFDCYLNWAGNLKHPLISEFFPPWFFSSTHQLKERIALVVHIIIISGHAVYFHHNDSNHGDNAIVCGSALPMKYVSGLEIFNYMREVCVNWYLVGHF